MGRAITIRGFQLIANLLLMMIPLALWQVFYKQIKSQTHCDKVLLESGDEFVSITIIRVYDKDIQQLKKVFR